MVFACKPLEECVSALEEYKPVLEATIFVDSPEPAPSTLLNPKPLNARLPECIS